MARTPNIIPSKLLNVALPLPTYTRLTALLYSELEGRVPHGAYSRHLDNLLSNSFVEVPLDLAPWLGCAPDTMVVRGTADAIKELQLVLTNGKVR